jgi:hypothetical protein
MISSTRKLLFWNAGLFWSASSSCQEMRTGPSGSGSARRVSIATAEAVNGSVAKAENTHLRADSGRPSACG